MSRPCWLLVVEFMTRMFSMSGLILLCGRLLICNCLFVIYMYLCEHSIPFGFRDCDMYRCVNPFLFSK